MVWIMILYKYIFYRAYYFCVNTFKEREIAHLWAAFIVALVCVTTILIFVKLYKFIMLPSIVYIYGSYHGYFSLGMALLMAYLLSRNNYYRKILAECGRLSAKRKKGLSVWMWIYLTVMVISFLYLGDLLRESYQGVD